MFKTSNLKRDSKRRPCICPKCPALGVTCFPNSDTFKNARIAAKSTPASGPSTASCYIMKGKSNTVPGLSTIGGTTGLSRTAMETTTTSGWKTSITSASEVTWASKMSSNSSSASGSTSTNSSSGSTAGSGSTPSTSCSESTSTLSSCPSSSADTSSITDPPGIDNSVPEISSKNFAQNVCQVARIIGPGTCKPTSAILNQYNHHVLLEGWEDQSRNEEASVLAYCRNRAIGGLLIEKTGLRASYLLKNSPIEKTGSYIQYDKKLQIEAPEIWTPARDRKGVYLSSTLSDTDETLLSKIFRSCQLVWSPHYIPCVKNIFCLKRVSTMDLNDAVNYGDEFYITTPPDNDHEILYIESTYPVVGTFDNFSNNCSVNFTPFATRACVWKAVAAKPEEREKKEGKPIYLDESLHLWNVQLGHKLSVESSVIYKTMFGREYEATAHNHPPINGKDRLENCLCFTVKSQMTRNWPPIYVLDSSGEPIVRTNSKIAFPNGDGRGDGFRC